ncbi:MAG: hypothetical protein OEY22_04855 [Candidatus Bathyarchaeota archaeon]|nr:hypothetical protein [Candidatus Bathyarchaeota archaeon]MDH5788066.1 hypothetical protein [Candidatus Bathyarchaeota archaeon]
MEKFGINTAKSYLGRNVNLHLKDGSVIINVHFSEILRGEFERETIVKCVPYGKRNVFRIPLRNIAWAELLNLSLILSSDKN